jgi:crotonobetainyl-CoA:carnitine CoA-transferase CaiB-like acyl-CoA transferase
LRPLDGIRVLDLTRVLAGPFCTMQLADMGAEVIKVEEPGRGDDTRGFGPPFVGGESTYFMSVNRGKRSLALNLKDPRGLDLVKRLARDSDIVVENFRPGVAERFGLDYAALSADNPRLIYASISGFGHAGLPEFTQLPGYDVVMQGMSGLQHITGEPGGPPFKTGVAISDLLTGLTAYQGILLALVARDRTGRGQFVDISMQDATVQVLTFIASMHLIGGRSPMRMGSRHPSICPYETFEAKDGYLNLAVGNDDLFTKFAALIGRPDLPGDERFRTNSARVTNREALIPIISAAFRERPVSAWLPVLAAAGIPAGPVLDIVEALAHPQLAARGMIVKADHAKAGPIRLLGVPIKLSDTPGAVSSPPPMLGQHTRDVLRDRLKIKDEEIEELARSGVVGLAR